MNNGIKIELETAINTGQTVTVSYDDPTVEDDSRAIQSLDGTDADSFGKQSVTNNSEVAPTSSQITSPSPSIAPSFISASTSNDGLNIILSYDQELSYENADPDAFSIKADSNSINVTEAHTHGYDVELTLEKAIQTGQSVLLDYIDPDESVDNQLAIQSLDGTDADSLSNESVTNNSEVFDTKTITTHR